MEVFPFAYSMIDGKIFYFSLSAGLNMMHYIIIH